MKTKVVLSKAQKVSTFAVMAAIAGAIGLGGLALTGGSVSAAPATKTTTSGSGSKSNTQTTTKPTTSSNSGSQTSSSTSDQTTTTPATTTATTPNTGLFTGDDEFTQADGIIMVTGLLAVALGGYVVYRNRTTIFRGRVNFDKR